MEQCYLESKCKEDVQTRLPLCHKVHHNQKQGSVANPASCLLGHYLGAGARASAAPQP